MKNRTLAVSIICLVVVLIILWVASVGYLISRITPENIGTVGGQIAKAYEQAKSK